MEQKHVITMRVSRKPAVPLLIAARSTGHYCKEKDWEQIPRQGDFIELFWGIRGACEFRIDGKECILHGGEGVFFFPGDWHLQRALEDRTEFYWLTMDGDYCREIIAAYQLPRTTFWAGRCPEDLFQRLDAEIHDLSLSAQYQAGATALTILHQALAAAYQEEDGRDLIHQFKKLVAGRFAQPDCNIELLADELGVHRSTLHRVFKQGTGMAPADYLNNYRIREAMELLSGTDLPVCEIAIRCGYADPNYFGKVFRRCSGRTPRNFRIRQS